jgi:hypothetical protein
MLREFGCFFIRHSKDEMKKEQKPAPDLFGHAQGPWSIRL